MLPAHSRLAVMFLLALPLVTSTPLAYAQDDWLRPTARAAQVQGQVRVDGVLDEEAWAAAPVQTDFTSASAGEENAGHPKRVEVQTRFRVLRDAGAVYVGVECDEPTPESLRATCLDHDSMVFTDDCIEVFFDPAGEGRCYHHFVVNTRGAWYDDYVADYGVVHNKFWDCPLEAAARVDPAAHRWTAELRIPLGALILPPKPSAVWLWNVTRERYAAGTQELSSWSPLKGNFHLPRRFGRLEGMDLDYGRFALAVAEPRASITMDEQQTKSLQIGIAVTNETGAEVHLTATAELFQKPETRVSAQAVSVAPGAVAEIALPAVKLPADLSEACYLVALTDAGSGELLKAVAKRISTNYQPIALKVLRPCYRNSIYPTEKLENIEFQVRLAQEVREKAETVGWRLCQPGTDPPWAGKSSVGDLPELIRLPAASLAEGTHSLEVMAWDAQGNAVASTEATIRKLPPPPAGNEVRVDEHGNILVNGKPFVAIGWYGSPATEDPRADVVALQNLQTPVVVTYPDVSPVTQAFADHGIYSIVSVENGRLLYTFELWRQPNHPVPTEHTRLSEPSPEMREYLRKLIERVRGEPGLLGYYIADEPEINNVRADYLENHYKLLAELDPYHPVIVTNDTLDGIVTHGYKCADILSPDPYSPELDYVPNFMKRCREVMRPGQAILLTPWHSTAQAHFTNEWGSAPPYPYRVFRNQYLVSLCYGARGWTGYTSAFFMPEIEYRYGLPYVWREVRFLEPAMGAPAPSEPLRIEADAEMSGWIRSANGQLYLVVVNHKPGSRTARISHPLLTGVQKLVVVSEAREVDVRDGAFVEDFPAGAARIYSTDPRGWAFETTQAVEEELARRKAAAAKPGNLFHVDRGVRARASEGYYAPWFYQYYYYAINGIVDDMGWAATHAGGKPAWLEVALKQPASIARVVIYTPNLRDYDLTFSGPQGDSYVAQIRGNERTIVEHTFQPPLPCLKLRVTALASREGAPQVSEIEAYETPGTGPPTPVEQQAATAELPQTFIAPVQGGTPNTLWSDDFTEFAWAESYKWDGHDTKWVLKPQDFEVTPAPGGGIVCRCTSAVGYAGMTHIFPYEPAYRFFQVKLSRIEGEGYKFTYVNFGSSSGRPGYRSCINTARPGIYTVDTHYVNEGYRTGDEKSCFITISTAGSQKREDGVITPGPAFTFDWIRLVRRPEDGLAVMMADGSPLPEKLKQGDELLFHLILRNPATDACVCALKSHEYSPLPINGQPYVQLVKVGDRDGREWAAKVKLGQDTGTFDVTKSGYPVVFRADIIGGDIKETYASAFVSVE